MNRHQNFLCEIRVGVPLKTAHVNGKSPLLISFETASILISVNVAIHIFAHVFFYVSIPVCRHGHVVRGGSHLCGLGQLEYIQVQFKGGHLGSFLQRINIFMNIRSFFNSRRVLDLLWRVQVFTLMQIERISLKYCPGCVVIDVRISALQSSARANRR